MTRSAAELAALAAGILPGMLPVLVQPVLGAQGDAFQVGVVQDAEGHRWIVRVPLTPAASAGMLQAERLLRPLSRRLPVKVPAFKGLAELSGVGEVAVYPYVEGQALRLPAVPAGSPLAESLGRTVSAIHNVEVALAEEAGVVSYDAQTWRSRRLAEVDRAAQTGHVPSTLVARWEQVLEDAGAWVFTPTLVHGRLTGANTLVAYASELDGGSGRVVAVLGWDRASIGDPAEDLAWMAEHCDPETFAEIVRVYRQTRVELPDPNLEVRARLAGELLPLHDLMTAVARRDDESIAQVRATLRQLDDDCAARPPLMERTVARPQPLELLPEEADVDTGMDLPAPAGTPTGSRAVRPDGEEAPAGGGDTGEAPARSAGGGPPAGPAAETSPAGPGPGGTQSGQATEDAPDGTGQGGTTAGRAVEAAPATNDLPKRPADTAASAAEESLSGAGAGGALAGPADVGTRHGAMPSGLAVDDSPASTGAEDTPSSPATEGTPAGSNGAPVRHEPSLARAAAPERPMGGGRAPHPADHRAPAPGQRPATSRERAVPVHDPELVDGTEEDLTLVTGGAVEVERPTPPALPVDSTTDGSVGRLAGEDLPRDGRDLLTSMSDDDGDLLLTPHGERVLLPRRPGVDRKASTVPISLGHEKAHLRLEDYLGSAGAEEELPGGPLTPPS